MKATISIDNAVLQDCGITIEQFQEAASNALGRLTHPAIGHPIYFNCVQVTVVADSPEISPN